MNTKALLLSILAGISAFAETQAPTSAPPVYEETQISTTSELKLNSTANRADKNFTVTGEVLGIGPSGVYGQGLNLGLFLNDSSLLSLELNGGKNSIHEGFLFTWGDSLTQEGYSVGVHFKKFVGNSFYIKTGADYRSIDLEYTDESWFSSDESTRSFTGESVAAAFSIGNQWQMKNFTIGCDWVGLNLPIASKVKNERYSANATQYDRDDNKNDMRRYVTGLGFTLVRFYLGASF